MRELSMASWLGCALALLLAAPAGAQSRGPRGEAPSRCVKYSQTEREDSMDLRLRSQCKAAVSCTVSWVLRCDGDASGNGGAESATFDLAAGESHSVDASAAACGSEGWQIRDVKWSCRTSS